MASTLLDREGWWLKGFPELGPELEALDLADPLNPIVEFAVGMASRLIRAHAWQVGAPIDDPATPLAEFVPLFNRISTATEDNQEIDVAIVDWLAQWVAARALWHTDDSIPKLPGDTWTAISSAQSARFALENALALWDNKELRQEDIADALLHAMWLIPSYGRENVEIDGRSVAVLRKQPWVAMLTELLGAYQRGASNARP